MTVKKQTRAAENADPHELNNPVPRVVLGVIAALVVWGVYYILASSPNSVAALGDQRSPLTLASAVEESGAIDGRQLYVAACQACHQAAGQGVPGVFPPLAGAEWVTGNPDILAQIVLHGMNGPITVSGATYNGAMPAFGEQFGDAELAALLTFVRGEWGNSGSEIDASTILAARNATQDRTQPWDGEDELRTLAQNLSE